ncbi:pilus assembly protein, partial [Rhizobium ruizarguesonis]
MFGFDPVVLAIIVLAAVSAAAVAYALLFSKIEADKKSASRINRVKSAESDRVKVKAARDRVQELSKRRKSVQDNLKDLEKRQHEKTKKTLSMKSRLVQAGLTITPAKFYLISAIFASVLLFVALVVGVSWMVMVGIAVVA